MKKGLLITLVAVVIVGVATYFILANYTSSTVVASVECTACAKEDGCGAKAKEGCDGSHEGCGTEAKAGCASGSHEGCASGEACAKTDAECQQAKKDSTCCEMTGKKAPGTCDKNKK